MYILKLGPFKEIFFFEFFFLKSDFSHPSLVETKSYLFWPPPWTAPLCDNNASTPQYRQWFQELSETGEGDVRT